MSIAEAQMGSTTALSEGNHIGRTSNMDSPLTSLPPMEEAIVVIKDIFRRYPNTYESIIATLCDNLDTLDEPDAKASMIWIIGEYAERIDNADELLESFLETFEDETPQVQLQMLTATVKLFLKRPADTQKMVQDVLTLATQDSDNPEGLPEAPHNSLFGKKKRSTDKENSAPKRAKPAAAEEAAASAPEAVLQETTTPAAAHDLSLIHI